MQRWYADYLLAEMRHKSVRIIDCNVKAYKYYDLIGDIGTIENYRVSTNRPYEVKAFAIRISGKENPRSEKGLFWLPPECLELINEKEKVMNVKTFDKDAKFAILTDPSNKDNTSVGVYYGDIKSGDIVVCDYHYGSRALSVRIVEIVDREPECLSVVDCEIMGVCDVTEYIERSTKRVRRAQLRAQMAMQAKKYQEDEYWRIISESDPTMKALYDEFKELEN